MSQQTISQGNPPIVWSTIDDAFQKINANFTELYLSIGGSGVDLSNIASDLIPDSNLTRDLGSVSRRWRDLYLGGSSLYLGNAIITADGLGAVNLPVGSRVGGSLIKDPTNVSFGQISTPGQSDVLANSETGILNFAGVGIDIVTNPLTDTITFSNSGVTGVTANTGISVSSASGSITISNTGVTSAVAGPGIAVSAPNGAVTITNNGVTDLLTDPGSGISLSSSSGQINITNSAPNIIQPVHRFIAVSGQVTLDATGPNSTLTFAGTNGVSLTTDSFTNTVTIGIADRVDVKGSVFADDSTVLVDSIDQKISAPGGFFGNITGDSIGYHTGDIKGSVFADDSTKIVDAVESRVTADLYGSVYDINENPIINYTNRTISGILDANDGTSSVTMNIAGLQLVSATLIDIQGSSGAQIGIGAGLSGDIYIGSGSNQTFIDGTIFVSTVDTADSSAIDVIPSVNLHSDLTVGGDILPNTDLGGNLGSPDKQWNSLYVSGSTIFVGGVPVSVESGILTVDGVSILGGGGGGGGPVLWSEILGKPTIPNIGSISFVGTTIDSNDSSSITFTPSVVFSSDVLIENELTISNTLNVSNLNVVGTITSQGSGTPELFSDNEIILSAGTRVEISNSPLKMASFTTDQRDSLLSENGDLIYNSTLGRLQNYAGGQWSDVGSGMQSRTTVSGGTSSLSDAATGNITITGFKGYLLYKIQVSHAAWVRVYTSTAARSSDSGRAEGVDPNPGAGVIAEVITTGAETILISPGTVGFNDESPIDTNIQLAVTNKSGGPASITVTLTVLKIED